MNNDKANYVLCEIDKPVEALRKTIFDNSIDIGIEAIEIGIDQLLDDGIIKDIPLLGVVYGFGKSVFAIRDIFLAKKIIVFTQNIQNGTVNREKIKNHKELLEKKPKKMYKELEIILNYLERHTKYIKNLMLGNFYLLYIDEGHDFNWNDFEIFAEIINNISVFDLEILQDIYTKKYYAEKSEYEFNGLALKRLNVCGLVQYFDGMSVMTDEIQDPFTAHITSIGEYFWEYGMNGVSINTIVDGEEMIL
jgi:hypothetical protein